MNTLPRCALAAAAILTATITWAGPDYPEVNESGLLRLDNRQLDAVYASPGLSFDSYRAIFVATPDVQFRKHWQRDQNRNFPRKVRDEDLQRIQERLAATVRDVFAAELGGAWTIAEAPGPGVLVLTPNIVELDVIAPDINTAGRTLQFSESAGEMTLNLSVADGASGEVLMTVIDRKRDFNQVFLEWRTSVTNQADARRLIRQWTRALHPLLQEPATLAGGQ